MGNSTVGITGGIGSGKSVVSRILRCNGFEVYDCDSEAKFLMANDSKIKESLQNELGEEIYNKRGDINKKKLSSLIFSDKKIRDFVNSIVHKAVKEDILRRIKKSNGNFFFESAILFSSGLDQYCSSIWVIESPLKERIERVLKRDNLSISEIEKRIKSQENEFPEKDINKEIIIRNDDRHPMLSVILKLTNKFNNQIFSISC